MLGAKNKIFLQIFESSNREFNIISPSHKGKVAKKNHVKSLVFCLQHLHTYYQSPESVKSLIGIFTTTKIPIFVFATITCNIVLICLQKGKDFQMAQLNVVCSVGHWSSVSIPTLENFYFYSRKILFFYFSFYSRSSRSEFQISLSTLEIRDQNLKFLLLLSKFEIRISNFSFYSRNSRSEFQISLSTLEIRDQNFKFLFLLSNLLFLTLVNACIKFRPKKRVNATKLMSRQKHGTTT